MASVGTRSNLGVTRVLGLFLAVLETLNSGSLSRLIVRVTSNGPETLSYSPVRRVALGVSDVTENCFRASDLRKRCYRARFARESLRMGL